MSHFTPPDITVMFLSLAVLLGGARLAGELARKVRQPSVLGEILAGILLGPTVLGHFLPAYGSWLFPKAGPAALGLSAIENVGVVLFLLVAGIEVDLSKVFRQGKRALSVSFFGIIIPFTFGIAMAWFFPRLVGIDAGADPLIFALFIGTALSISALPVIAKVLMDLKLMKTDLGALIMTSAMANDLVGWTLFALVMGMVNAASPSATLAGIGLTVLFVVVVLTAGRWLIHRALPWIQAHASWPGGVLGFIFTLTLAAAAFTEFVGIDAIFGAFIMGIAIGESSHLREQTREHIHQIVTNVFAPLFFAGIGLRLDFLAHFNAPTVLVIFLLACVGKLAGGWLGARIAGMRPRSAWAVAFAMNARGAMEIILGILALRADIIRDKMFVALVIMAIATSLLSGPALTLLLRRRRVTRLQEVVSAKLFLPGMVSRTRHGTLRELCALAGEATGCSPETLFRIAWNNAKVTAIGLENGVAAAYAAVPGLEKPAVAAGLSEEGIDFNSPDGKPARVIFLVLTPGGDSQSLLDVMGDIETRFGRQEATDKAGGAGSFVEFLAALNAPVR